MTMSDDVNMRLHMTANGLGWMHIKPITEPELVRGLLEDYREQVVASVAKPVSTISHDSQEVGVGEYSFSIDDLAVSAPMGNSFDPLVKQIEEHAKHSIADTLLMPVRPEQPLLASKEEHVLSCGRICCFAGFAPLVSAKDISKCVLPVRETPKSYGPNSIGMGRPAKLSGVEFLRRMHCVCGHPSLETMLKTLTKAEFMSKGIVTEADVKQFAKEGWRAAQAVRESCPRSRM